MIRRKAFAAAVLLALLLLLLTGCDKSSDEQYQTVFGVSSAELIPTVGNAAYSARSLTGEDKAADAAEDGTVAAPAEDNYVDPTAGLDCSE